MQPPRRGTALASAGLHRPHSLVHRSAMAHTALTSCFLLLAATSSFAQSGTWERVWPAVLPSLVDVTMVSALDGWVAGADGSVLHTTSGGIFWNSVQLPTDELCALSVKGSLVWAVGNGIQRSIDGGQIWTTVNSAADLEDVFFVSPTQGWAVGSLGRVLRSTDGGANWIASTLPGVGATLRAVYFASSLQGWAVGDGGLHFKSTDGGANWTSVVVPSSANFTDVFYADAQRGWIAAGDAVLRTIDGGGHWQSVALPSGARADKLSVLGGNWLWGTASPGRIVHSSNAGQTWSVLHTSTLPLLDVGMGDLSNGLAVGVDGLILRTTDGGAGWTTVAGGSSPGTTKLVWDVVHRGALVWAALTDSVILRSTDDGANWQEIPAGLPQTAYRSIDFADDLSGFAVGRRSGFYPTTAWTSDGGLTWNPTYWSGMYEYWDVDALTPQIAIACADNGIWRTSNGGPSWSFVNTVPLSGFFGADFIDANRGWAVGYDIFRTGDGGQSWTFQLTPALPLRDVSFADAMSGWAVGDQGSILFTNDGGVNWTPQSAGTSSWLQSVEATGPLSAWISGTGGFAARTLDGGANWIVDAPGDLGATDCYGTSFDAPDRGWLAGYYPQAGIWKRSPSACSWSAYCQGKISSNGLEPVLDVLGTPSVSQSPAIVRASSALPNKVGLVLYGKTGSATLPFMGGTLCVAPPLTRLPPHLFDAFGSTTYAIDVQPAMAGTTRWYQLWQRDPQHPDGTGVTLSRALSLSFCP